MSEFIVKITAKPSVSDEVLKLLLARAFNTAPEKFDQMLEHTPPVIVARKPSEGEAQAMASKFESLGFHIEVLERSTPSQNSATKPGLADLAQPAKVQESPALLGGLPRNEKNTARSGRPMAVDNLGEGVLALPSKRAIRWPTLPALTLSRTLSEKPPSPPPVPARPTLSSLKDPAPAQGPRAESLPTQVVEPDRIDTLVERTPRRLSLQSRVFLAGALPMLLSIILVGLTLHQAVPPMLHNLLQGTARTSAATLALALRPLLQDQANLSDPALRQALETSRVELQGQNVAFAILTDANGNPLQGWNAGSSNVKSLPQDLAQPLKQQAQQVSLFSNQATSQVVVLPDQTMVVAAAPLQGQGKTIGALVVGINALGFAEGFQDVLRNVLLAGLLPVFLAILAALMVTRAITRVIMQLTRAAERIGMGDLNTEIGVRTGDELELLSHAMDRMRLGLQKHFDRQKRL